MPRPDSTTHSLNEALHLVDDAETGLKGAIAIHSTVLGPAAGGCRLWSYPSHADLVTDALRLAQGMSYKNAMAGLPFGGGKAVLMAPLGADRRAVFRAFGRAVEQLHGGYVTAEDVGTSVADMEAVRAETRHVAGLTARPGFAGGDPSPWTALGVFLSIELAVARRLGTGLDQVTVAVQGLGSVGQALCSLLHEAGADLIVADLSAERVRDAVARYGALPAAADQIHKAYVDVFAPCALGAGLSEATIPFLQAGIVCGAANNQLATADDGARLAERGVLYCPDYVVNAGGIINVAAEYLGETGDQVEARVRQIPSRLAAVLDRAAAQAMPTAAVADRMAADLVAGGARAAA